MKIGIYLEGSPEMGGGFFQSLKSSLLLLDIEKYKSEIELIITHSKTKEYLQKKKIHNKLFRLTKVYNYLSQLFEIDYSRELLRKIKINHPFYNFIKKQKYDLIIFLGPSQMSKFCEEVAFISNIWDLDHKKNSQFPEHNLNNIYEHKEKLFKEIVTRAFKILVPHKSNKNDLINFYKADENKVIVQNFIPMLPTIYNENKHNKELYKDLFKKFNLPLDKIIIFYPAQFWAHKNHKYIIDAAEILKKENNKKYLFIFCGGNKGNFKYIKDLISKKQLGDFVKIHTFLTDDEVISFYLNSHGVIMPTYCGPTNLPIYEAFYFKKIIFYTKDLIPDDPINNHLIEIDISSPVNLCKQLEIYTDTERLNKIVLDNYEYYKLICNENTFKENYEKILNEFSYLLHRWK
jgi:glycosyltransferase involved in cell wall biosynthesis